MGVGHFLTAVVTMEPARTVKDAASPSSTVGVGGTESRRRALLSHMQLVARRSSVRVEMHSIPAMRGIMGS
jgi:hypothetical protein